MSAETVRIDVQYDVKGIDQSVRDSQRLLYAMNAIRLSVRDFQDLVTKPTLENAMWTAIQLTRVYTSLYRLVKATNDEQKATLALSGANTAAGMAGGAAGGAAAGAVGGALAEGILFPTLWFFATNPIAAVAVGAAAATIGIVAWDMNEKKKYKDWLEQQRETAKSQGLEY